MVGGISCFPQAVSAANSPRGPKEVLILHPGQVVPGIVLEADAENAVILINGVNVAAELKTSAVPGEKLMLEVIEQRADGKMLLQKVVAQGRNEQALAQEELKSILDHLGLQNSKLNETMVMELIRLGIPLNHRTMDLLSTLAVKNNLSPQQVPALTWLWARGLPITKEGITAIADLMEGCFKDTKVAKLFRLFSDNGAASRNAAVEANLIDGDSLSLPKNLGRPGLEVVEQLLLRGGETEAQWGQKLLDTLTNLGLGYERDLLRLLEQMGGHNGGPKDMQELAALLRGGEAKTLKAALIEMLNGENQPQGEGLRSANSVAQGVLREITGYQLLNISGRQETDGVSLFVPGWVALQSNEIQPFFLKVKQYYGQRGDFAGEYQCQVLFFISTKEMGEVMCRLALENNCLSCKFTVAGTEEARLLDSMLPMLHEKLQSLPWKTVFYSSRVLEAEEINRIWIEETFAVPEKSFSGLDARI